MRNPTVGNPEVTISGISGDFSTTMVKGPGQYFCASSSAMTGQFTASLRAISIEAT